MTLLKSNIFLTLYIFLFVLQTINSQNIRLIQSEVLPSELNETSGIISLNHGLSFWTINDGGNDPILYEINIKGEILRHVVVKNATNVDWEDLTTDFEKYIYIADSGNNSIRNVKQAIYQVLISDLIARDSIFGNRIELYFDNGRPIKKRQLDIEAICCIDDKLYMFTKNWSSWFINKSTVYLMEPNVEAGLPILHSRINLGWHFFAEQQITGACYDEASDQIFLISATSIFNLPRNHLNKAKIKIKNRYGSFSFLSQKESICAISSNHFVITQEKNKHFKQKATIFEVVVNPQ